MYSNWTIWMQFSAPWNPVFEIGGLAKFFQEICLYKVTWYVLWRRMFTVFLNLETIENFRVKCKWTFLA